MVDPLVLPTALALFLPLTAFLLLAFSQGRLPRPVITGLALAFSCLSMVAAYTAASRYYQAVLLAPADFPSRAVVVFTGQWLNLTPTLTASLGLFLDPIATMMLVLITTIAFLVTVYSVGYMDHDPAYGRFFALLSLFAFSMLGLVMAPNILQTYIFWELVGVCSYALIGFWYQKPAAVAASKKAFIVTRFADSFFLLGIILTASLTNTFDFEILATTGTAAGLDRAIAIFGHDFHLLTVAGLLVFAGCWGKSAMFPLHIWLPDAMEGPTPVSSIIHSATMVVAGVFLTARMLPFFAGSAFLLTTISTVGTFTAFFAALVAITQVDIKRILAFSTLSQLGLMMLALGAARLVDQPAAFAVNGLAYSAAMFHIFTHAFFKCLLFLSAGAVIHMVHSNDLAAMGGLRRSMPWTYGGVLAACLAISGIFPFSGFWSKDAILLAAWQSGQVVPAMIGLGVGAMTAFYMFRFFFLIFHGPAPANHPVSHENPWMSPPIVILAVPALLAGYLGKDWFTSFCLPPMPIAALHAAHPAWLPVASTGAGLAGLLLAWLLYGSGDLARVRGITARLAPLYRLVYAKFYINEACLFVTRTIIFLGVAAPIKWFDRQVVDGTMNGLGRLLQAGGAMVRWVQNGQLPFYLGSTVLGMILLLIINALRQ
ncbi:MAG: NADH-quinone oxidoreductase subunit L [Deltaproteobacteria bacterium CG23_combo_of_CG06-09_8_20_14_all_60_8]|nr:MAG: NADH-quinone oxidoreductase subunit L [Deltaproteobacteria bacterium CG23_combo_of_CG06-09_8_20_14_all_60_8]